MTLTVSFDLEEQDLDYFRDIMQKTYSSVTQLSEQQVLASAKSLANSVEQQVPTFVADRLAKLRSLIDLVEDTEWDLTSEEKAEVLAALAYFAKPQDLIADHVPVLGFLDDAIMIELVARSLEDDLQAYSDFCQFRSAEITRRGPEANTSKADWLEAKRQELHSWMRRRRAERRSGSASGGFRSVFSFRG